MRKAVLAACLAILATTNGQAFCLSMDLDKNPGSKRLVQYLIRE
jgi:hypothetical protein